MKFFNRYIPLILGVLCLYGVMRMVDEYPHPSWPQVLLILFCFLSGVVMLYDFVRFRHSSKDDDPSRGH